ncbi:hypothetical protein POM88_017108 [Heracleum sosnowskyi]|uniref:TF-B3 domain-containing protein n=1 Tax=Heracleum sosnowskyi TaxID=360622 RepID=A0AAD8IRY8_9APIA|nr:hypothetical protein POM88_017108 [Heracleum sosnowskyi]
MDMDKFIENPYLPNWKRDQYVLNASTLEYEKAGARWVFNAYRNYANYFEMRIKSLDIDQEMDKLRLQTGLEKLYKDWKDGDTVVLIFVSRGWEIAIERKDEICEFGNGWQAFTKETELEPGDTLVFYKLNDCKDNTVNICIFKAADNIINNRKDDGDWNISFLKVISGSSMNEGMLVVPKCFKETYGQMMSEVNRIEIGGEKRFIFYSFIGGYLANIFQILDYFHVCPKETAIFTMDNTTILHGRLYQEDGREIDYTNRLKGCSISGGSNWIWSITWKDDIGKEKENVAKEDNEQKEKLDIGNVKDDWQSFELQNRDSSSGMEIEAQESENEEEEMIQDHEQMDLPQQFTAVLTKSNIDKSTHGVYIPKSITPRNRSWKSGERVLLTTDAGSWTVGVVCSKATTRFSAGWNTFAGKNEFITNQRLVFTMKEEADGIVFEVEKQ